MRYAVDPTIFRLRPVLTDDDHEFLVELHNDPQVLKNLTHSEPISMGQHLAWWEKIRRNPNQIRMIFEVGGERCGFAKFYDVDQGNRNCMLGGDIHRDFRGQGYAKYMWSLMLRKCFDELKLYRVGLTTAEYNEVGQHVYCKLGFQEEGRLIKSLWRNGQFHDQILMYMLYPDWVAMEEQT